MKDLLKYRAYAERVKIFHGLQPEEIEYILHHGRVLFFQNGDTIFHQGQLGNSMFIVLSGRVALYDKDCLMAHMDVGELFGEMAVLTHRPRTATAAAEADTRLFALDDRQVAAILDQQVASRLLINIIHTLSDRLEHADAEIARMRHHHPVSKNF